MPLTFIWMYPKSPLQYILYFRHNPIAYRLQNRPDFQRRALFSRELRRPSEWIYFFWSSLERSDSTYRPFAFHGYFLSLKLTFYHKILTGNFISSWSFFSSIFSNAMLLINNNPTENIDHHHYWRYHRGLMCAGLIRHSISVLSPLLRTLLLLLPKATYCLPPTYLHSLQAGYDTPA